MPNSDEGRAKLAQIIEQFRSFCDDRGRVTEADTRAKVITKVLTDVCCWPEGEIDREGQTDAGRLDYRLRVRDKAMIVVEAKSSEVAFTLPVEGMRKTYSLDGSLTSDKEVREAFQQVRDYCDSEGIRYAIATNGDAWIVFRAVRDDGVGWKKGYARVFPSLRHIHEHFTDFWNLLSYEAISAGSLNNEFASTTSASRQLLRVIDRVFNANMSLKRNRLNSDMRPLIKLVFEDVADQDELDVLNACYIHTGSLRSVAYDLDHIISDAIPKFLMEEGTKSIGKDFSQSGFLRTLSNSINVTKGDLFLLLGGIGCGKSTFLKRYQRSVGRAILEAETMWFVIDFIKPPQRREMETFVWQTLLDNIRTRYQSHECEKRRYVKEVFASDIAALHTTYLSQFKPGTHRYEEKLSDYLTQWMEDLSRYVPGLVQVACKRLERKPVVFIDNVDQLDPDYQAEIFLLAQRVASLMSAVTIIALREESYYTANVRKTFTAYSSRKFHIAPPHFRRMIGNRIEYALRGLDKEAKPGMFNVTEQEKRQSLYDFLTIVQGGILENDRIGRFIKAICHGNMRLALEMFSTFVTSGVTDVDKMLRIYYREGWYSVAFHEFVKAIMLGDNYYYKEEQSPICNIFNVGTERNSSHFTAWRIIQSLLAHCGESTREGRGYVELSRMIYEFEDVFDNAEDFLATMNRLTVRQLVEANTRSTETIEGASHVRVTSAGWYYTRYLANAFAYLDLVLQDTPINDAGVEKRLRDSVYLVNNLVDSDDQKLERVTARFARVELFLEYLSAEENSERQRFGLDRLGTPIAGRVMDGLRDQFTRESNWIDRRLRENRERFREEHASPVYEEEEALLGVALEGEEAATDSEGSEADSSQ